MTPLIATNGITAVVYPPLISLPSEVRANLTTAKDDLVTLGQIVGSISGTVNSTLRIFNAVALNSHLPDLSNLIEKVALSANNAMSDCMGTLALYRSIASATTTEITQLTVDLKWRLWARFYRRSRMLCVR